ncbi:hypothetical protein HK096_003876 [Nowakowskiella sp. JEL0078]|nr:hypothetical protein HK096_003876 [Nowakowskiella sp. JEL0078]
MSSLEDWNSSGETRLPVSTVIDRLDLLPLLAFKALTYTNQSQHSTLQLYPQLAPDENCELSNLPLKNTVLDNLLAAESEDKIPETVPSAEGISTNIGNFDPHKKRGHRRTKSLALSYPVHGVSTIQQLSPAGNTYDWVLPESVLIPESAFKDTTKIKSTATVNNRSTRVKFKEPTDVDGRQSRSQHLEVNHFARSSSEPVHSTPISFGRRCMISNSRQTTQFQKPLSSLSPPSDTFSMPLKGFRNAKPWNKTNDSKNLKKPNLSFFPQFQQMRPIIETSIINSEPHLQIYKSKENLKTLINDLDPGILDEDPFFHHEIESTDLFADFELSRYFNGDTDVEIFKQNISVKLNTSGVNFQDFCLPNIRPDSNKEELQPLKLVNSRGRAWTVSTILPQLC